MKMKNKLLLIISLLLIPTIIFASGGDSEIPIEVALIMEAFVSIHMSIFVLKPLSEIFSKENSKKIFWTLFIVRAIILIYCDFFVTTFIAAFDFFGVFIGAFIIVPICSVFNKKTKNTIKEEFIEKNSTIPATSIKNQTKDVIKGIELKCAKCNSTLQISDKVCMNCGEPFDGNNVIVSENANTSVKTSLKVAVLPTGFDKIYSLEENEMLEEFINRELTKAGIDKYSKLIPSDILKRKKILNIIFSILIFAFITLIFFHFPIYTYIVGLVILFILFKATRKYDLIKYLEKQVKARPGEKISNIVMNVKNTLVTDNLKGTFTIYLLVAVILPLIIFSSPRTIYERVEGGYALRYYTFGLTNFTTATISETYKNENVVSLRGNTFSNMFFLKSVSLPDSIVEIRGQAFKNCFKLEEVNIPQRLEYLGGGAFYKAKSIKNIELPDSLTYLGGEAFYGAKSLEYIKLSNNLTEIRGNSFENCTSLKSITIPDNVTRIGGHAFYGNSSLSEVSISKNSKLFEIGSSAFRRCPRLHSIYLPFSTIVNERAFKESPTTINRYNHYTIKDKNSNNNIPNNNDDTSNNNDDIPNNNDNISNNNDEITNNLNKETVEVMIDNKNGYQSDFIPFSKTSNNNKISLNNGLNNILYHIVPLYNQTAIVVSGNVSNINYLSGSFDMKTDYYNSDFNKIGSCMKQIKLLGKGYSYISFSCRLDENEINGNLSDIKYYKINLSNYITN